jgi:hypothetical protein
MDIQVTDRQLRQLGMICIAIAMAGTIICLVAIFVGQGNMDVSTSTEDVKALRYAHLFLATVSIFTSRIIGEKVLAGKMQKPGGEQQPFFQRYQSSAIVQLAAIEGLTLFGAVIVMMTPAAVLANDPTYYLHLTPLVLLLLRAKQLYPTQDKLQMLARAYQS